MARSIYIALRPLSVAHASPLLRRRMVPIFVYGYHTAALDSRVL